MRILEDELYAPLKYSGGISGCGRRNLSKRRGCKVLRGAEAEAGVIEDVECLQPKNEREAFTDGKHAGDLRIQLKK